MKRIVLLGVIVAGLSFVGSAGTAQACSGGHYGGYGYGAGYYRGAPWGVGGYRHHGWHHHGRHHHYGGFGRGYYRYW